ncbi:MAG: redox-sensing transcriptional repressor Rex [Muribaculaceae bacterium]|nr:redox-sensing transcriptional repressor Rex [Bacteroidales bacterium]MBD5304282.1 redox-sensing transcriptional repressor Rex [Bacteroides sp.]MBD5340472.1 redox-sensing transcriptional repressor Rex [Bacteroides sp.]MDE6072604.1 redox-sensing transcriptional repressor Rex [Muribaculaceae bacterium]
MNIDNNLILPEPTLRRLPWYLAYVEILKSAGTEYVSSTQISRALSVDASQIAKDLSFLNIKGKTRIGYEVETLIEALSDFLGFTRSHKAYVFGAGSLGKALIRDSGLSNYGLEIVAGFDVNPDTIARKDLGVPIYHIDQIYDVMETNPASIAILTVPAQSAQECADTAISAGVKAIWNFSPYRVKVAEGVVMANTSIYAHLALIFNRLEANKHRN